MNKVLYISDSLKQRSGVTSVIMNYIERISDDELRIDLLVYDDSEKEVVERAEHFGATVYYMPRLRLMNIIDYQRKLNSFFQEHEYDIVHSHFNQIDSIVFPIARKNGARCCISHSHSTKLSESKIKAVRNRLMCWNIGWNADVLAACSEKAGVFLYGNRFANSKKKMIIHNGVDVDRFRFSIKKRNDTRGLLGVGKDEILLGHVGSFNIIKNQAFIISMFSDLKKRSDKYRLLLVGDGDTRSEIEKLVKNTGLDKYVIFTGVRSDVDSLLSAMDIFVLPSLSEGLPVSGIEAQVAGLTCIFSENITREVDMTGSIFLPIDDPSIWAKVIIKADTSHKPENERKIREYGYDIDAESLRLKKYYMQKIIE